MSESGNPEENHEVDYEEAGINDEYCPENPEGAEAQPTEEKKESAEEYKIFPNILFIYGHKYNSVSAREIRKHFEPFGKVRDVSCRSNLAFVEFENAEDAARAKAELHRQPGLGSPTIIVDYKKDIPPKVSCFFFIVVAEY